MKRFITFGVLFLFILTLTGCSKEPANTPVDTVGKETGNYVQSAWTGEFSEEKLKETIEKYNADYETIVFIDMDDAKKVSFQTDFDVSSCKVIRLSPVYDTNMNIELEGYIDLHVPTAFSGKEITVFTDWWSEQKSTLWSYLVYVSDTEGTIHYYYFRTDYSACK